MVQESSRAKYLIKNTAIFAIGNIATKLITFFLVPLYTNALATDQYGTADLVTTLCAVLAPVLILNIGEGVMRFSLDDGADYNKIMSVGLALLALSFAIGLVIIPIAGLFGAVADYTIYIYFYTVTLAGSQLFLCYLRGKELLVRYAVGNILQTIAVAVLNILFLLVLDLGLPGYFMAYILSSAVAMVYAFLAGNVVDVFRNFKIDFDLAKEMSRYSAVLIPNTFMWWIINSSDRVLVTALLGTAANGIYAVSYKIPSVVSVVAGIFNQAWSYTAIHEDGSEDRDEYCDRVYGGLVGVSVVTGVALLLFMKPIMGIYVEASYYEAWRYTPFLIIGNVFMTTGTFLGSWYTVNKDSKGYLFSATFGAIVNVLLNLALIPFLGITGSALATCFSYITVYAYRVFDTKRYVNINTMKASYAAAYVVLFLAGGTLFMDGAAGELLMLAELLAVIAIFRREMGTLFCGLLRIVKERLG